MLNRNNPASGNLLLSEPFMLDPTFERAVVLLGEHDENGSLGFILNNMTSYFLSDFIPGNNNDLFPIYFGGPVQTDSLFYIHRAADRLDSGSLIYDDIYFGEDFDSLLFLIEEKLIQPNEVKFFLGYSGWAMDQLMTEINQNSWIVHQSFDSSLPFIYDNEELWKQSLISLGPKYAHIANFPKSPNLN